MVFDLIIAGLARLLRFRHRPLGNDLSYRTADVLASILFVGVLSSIYGSVTYVIGDIWPQATTSMPVMHTIAAALAIGLVTLWMPLIEHLSLLQPGDLTPRGRRVVVVVARAIPYMYGLMMLLLASVMAALLVGLATMGLILLTPTFAESLSVLARWSVINIAFVVMTRWIFGTLLAMGLSDQDWGLPSWRRWIEPGQNYPAGSRFFDPLDRTLGRVALRLAQGSSALRSRKRPQASS